MTPADLSALRAKACTIVAALGSVCDRLTDAEETLRNPTPDKPVSDAVLVSQMLHSAGETAELLTEAAHELALAIEQAKAAARSRAAALGRLGSLDAQVFGTPEGGA